MSSSASQSLWVPRSEHLGSTNTVLFARSRTHFVHEFPGPLSIKTVVEGQVAWKRGRRQTWVDESSFLILNDGEEYSMEIDSVEPVATACVFFAHGFVESIYVAALQPLRGSDEPAHALPFHSCLYPRSDSLAAKIAHLRTLASRSTDALVLDECFSDLAWQLLLLNEATVAQIRRIPALRAGTRVELFRRLARGREFLHANAAGSLCLDDVAQAACLSPFHFQRTFRRVFGCTPSQYLTELRLQKAARLLRSDYPVTRACLEAGFNSLGSFSAAFRKRFGSPPSTFRKGFDT